MLKCTQLYAIQSAVFRKVTGIYVRLLFEIGRMSLKIQLYIVQLNT